MRRHLLRPVTLVAIALVAMASVLASMRTSVSIQAAANPVSFDGPVSFAASVPADWTLSDPADPGRPHLVPLGDYETRIGRELDAARVFARWDSKFPTSYHTALRDRGSEIVFSIASKYDNGTVIPWAEVAAAQPGDPLHDDLIGWGDKLAAFGGDVLFTFHHEAEIKKNDGFGTTPEAKAAEYRAAFRNVVSVLKSRGVEAQIGFIGTSWGYGQTGVNSAASFYPGDDIVDQIGVDAYNWGRCRDRNGDGIAEPDVRSLETIMASARRFADARPSKPTFIAELGVADDASEPLFKALWLDEAREYLGSDAWPQLRLVSSFEVFDAGFPDCIWRTDTDPHASIAFCRMANDARLGGDPALDLDQSCGARTWLGETAPTCSAEREGGGARLTWTADGASSLHILRDGRWIARATDLTDFTDSRATVGSHDYVLRVRGPAFGDGASYTDIPCGSVELGPQCGVSMVGGVHHLEWDVNGFTSIHLLRDGRWIANATALTAFDDTRAAPGDHTYTLRVRGRAYGEGAQFLELTCTTI